MILAFKFTCHKDASFLAPFLRLLAGDLAHSIKCKEDEICHKIHSYDYPIEVQFEGKDDLSYYDLEGCPVWSSNPTLSTSPYTLQGFEQKAPVPTFEEAPSRLRRITIKEAARIQSFPDDYKFYGSKGMIYTQIGNAVPCKLAGAVAKAVCEYLVS